MAKKWMVKFNATATRSSISPLACAEKVVEASAMRVEDGGVLSFYETHSSRGGSVQTLIVSYGPAAWFSVAPIVG